MKLTSVCTTLLLALSVAIAACQQQPANSDTVAAIEQEPAAEVFQSPGKPNVTPLDVHYRLLDIPQVGEPFGLELTIVSTQATTGLGYSVDAESALVVDPRGQQRSFAGKPARTPEKTTLSITPVMEGRFYVHVSGNGVVNGKNYTRVVTIPIQVGQGTRQLEQIGEVRSDADGNPVVSLPAKTPED